MREARAGAADQILVVTLDRPERANAYTSAMLGELALLLERARADRSVAALVLHGAGRSFCAGADLDELSSRDEGDALSLLSRDVFDRLAEAPWPTIAAIDGPAVAGGLELALACDLRVCSARARFRLPEIGLGLLPAAGGIRRLVAELGLARAKQMVLFGQTLEAEAALGWGLVADVVDDPLAHALEVAGALAPGDAMCVAVAKMLLHDQAETARGRAGEAIGQALFYGRRRRSALS